MNDWLWVEALRSVVRHPIDSLVFGFGLLAIAVALVFGAA